VTGDLPNFNGRSSGVLLHPTSLPGPHGIGDLGPAAHRFVDWLADAGQRWWQMLPIGPIGTGNSPYDSPSAFAGSPLLISLEKLADEGLLTREDVATSGDRVSKGVPYAAVARFKQPRLRRALQRFAQQRRPDMDDEFDRFRAANRTWLPDFALFCAIKQVRRGVGWTSWQAELRSRKRSALESARREHAAEVSYHEFVQFQFHRQWMALRAYSHDKSVGLIGDLPIFVAHDSADVWAHPDLFWLDRAGKPTVVAGVGPDYFSKTGQLWGNPHYRWGELRRRGYDWWIARFRKTFERFDVVRLDHFIGFHRYWEVPASAKTAESGRWRTGPGAELFDAVRRRLGPLPMIAEDLGAVTPEVKALRDQFGFPGMRVLQFAFGNDPEALNFQPHNYPHNCVVYTGTHDNDTTAGWFRETGTRSPTRSAQEIARENAFALEYLGSNGTEIHWDMIRAALMSVANTAIIPFQDLLGLGSSARMNWPGTDKGNWEWRLSAMSLTALLAQRLARMTKVYGRG
jgi:4-alpha-glucanotransferase